MQNNTDFTIRELTQDEIIEIYQTTAPLHFPKEELRPLFNIKNIMNRNGYRGFGLFRNAGTATRTGSALADSLSAPDTLAGYAFFITLPDSDVMLLDYFAMLEEYRSQGLGGMFLQKMRDGLGRDQNTFTNPSKTLTGIFIETEDIACATTDTEKSLRKRRNDFYVRNGAVPTGLHDTLGTADYEIFFLPITQNYLLSTDHTANALQSCLDKLYRFMLEGENEICYEKIVRWR